MERYRKVKTVRLDLLRDVKLTPLGAFVRDGVIYPGYIGQNQRVNPVKNLISMVNSDYGSCLLAVTSAGETYYGSRLGGASLQRIYSDGAQYGFVFETRDPDGPKAVALSGTHYTVSGPQGRTHGSLSVSLSCGVMKNGRLFGCDSSNRYMLRWSGTGGWQDWEEEIGGSGHFFFKPDYGYITGIFDMDGEIVVLFEYGIARVSVGGNPETFRIIDILKCPHYRNSTAALAADGLYFVTDGGFMRYSNGKITLLKGLITDDIQSTTSGYIGYGQFYFVCGSSRSLAKNVVYVYDIFNEAYQIADVPAYFVNCDSTSLLAYTDSTVYRLKKEVSGWRYTVQTENLDFGCDQRKLIKRLEIDCDTDISLSIANGIYQRSVSKPAKRTRVFMRGPYFCIKFTGATGRVRSAYITVEVPE